VASAFRGTCVRLGSAVLICAVRPQVVGLSPSLRVVHYFSAADKAVEASRVRRQIHGPYPGSAPVLSGYTRVESVSAEGARCTQAGHDYGQVDGFCLRDQRDFLDGVPPARRLLDPVAGDGGAPGHWKLRLG
jgi:hypothetical protein